ncbi:M28 family metallopeptidase [Simiduia curdlanivorans]|uniref:M28 family metallopeptidase n=1 Tax=Simiduia curdlanivorans TaxID=1492769 RepID=A0ABV8UYH9_9GAMM|nr:M28 family metallopeptidase [Simiduia curdlanivorans]MDN3640356.1 M28 family metallopeptidase [Simiduia curdlanivorans]
MKLFTPWNLLTCLTLTALLLAEVSAATWQAPPSERAELYAIGVAADAARIERDITQLVGFGTRHTLSETASNSRGIGASRRWIEAEFRRISSACGDCLEVITVADTVSGKRIPEPTEVVNVIAIQKGKRDPKRVVMMAGDIDSRVTDPMNASADSPGANDNGSGVAGVLEAARLLSQYSFNGSIVYAALSGEEQGLYGGAILAKYAQQQGWNIDAVLNNDMIGNIEGINGVIDNHTARVFSEGTRFVETAEEANQRRFTGGEVDSASRNLARFIKKVGEQYVPNLDIMMIYRLDRFGRGGHHRPFNEAGFPGVRIMETWEHYDRQHQDLRRENGISYGDSLAGVNFPYAAKLTGLNAVVLASMAWAPAPPAQVEISGQVSANTQLSWAAADRANAKTLAGYRIYWRLTTEAEWSHSRYVGKVQSFTLENIVIDNYYFGVAAVGLDGSESPVVFPGPAGRF